MNVELRGAIRAALGTKELQLDVPAGGVPLSQPLELIAAAHPRARAHLTLQVAHPKRPDRSTLSPPGQAVDRG